MRAFERSWVVGSLLLTAVAAGCRDESAELVPLPSATTSAAEAQIDPAERNPDPLITKTYRLDACYFGTLTFHQARNAYLASLGGAEPSTDKIPDFGASRDEASEAPHAAPGLASAAASGSAHAAPSAAPQRSALAIVAPPPAPAPSAKASASAAASASAGDKREGDKHKLQIDPNRRINQVRYEYFARLCKTAASLKTPESPDLDKALDDYTAFALGFAKDLTDANMYYQKEEFKADGFARGKELHTKLLAHFKALDDEEKKLADAIKTFETANPVSRAGWTDSQTLSDAVVQAGRAVYEDLDAEKLDLDKTKADLAKLESATDALSKHNAGDKEAQDPFVLIVAPAGDREAKAAHAILDAPDAKTPKPAMMIALGTYFEQILDGNYRALLKQLRPGNAPMNVSPKMQIRPRLPNGHPLVAPQPGQP